MQRGEKSARVLARRRLSLRRGSRTTRPDPPRPAQTRSAVLYRVHVGDTPTPDRGTWAAYVAATRTRVGLNKSELARRLGIDRGTVHRWEQGTSRPEDAVVVTKFAHLFGLDVDEVLTVAGLRVGTMPTPTQPTKEPPLDPDLRIIMRRLADPAVSEAEKTAIRATLNYLANIASQQERAEGKERAAS